MLTWPIYFWGADQINVVYDKYVFWVLTVCFNPLQGFWNAFVDFRYASQSGWKEGLGLKTFCFMTSSTDRRSQAAGATNAAVVATRSPPHAVNNRMRGKQEPSQALDAVAEARNYDSKDVKNDRDDPEDDRLIEEHDES